MIVKPLSFTPPGLFSRRVATYQVSQFSGRIVLLGSSLLLDQSLKYLFLKPEP
jgi:hypothetical protein